MKHNFPTSWDCLNFVSFIFLDNKFWVSQSSYVMEEEEEEQLEE